MAARTKARKRAVDVLYEADVRGDDRLAVLRDRIETANPPVPEHTIRLVEGVAEHAARIDALIEAHAANWSLERLPDVDRALACLGPCSHQRADRTRANSRLSWRGRGTGRRGCRP